MSELHIALKLKVLNKPINMSSLSVLLPNFSLSQSLQVHNGAVRCLSLIEDLVLTGSYDSTLFLGRLLENKYEPVTTYSHHTSAVYSCILTPDMSGFYSGDKSGAIYFSDLTGTNQKIIGQHAHAVSSIDISDNFLLTGSWDATAKLWDIEKSTCTVDMGANKHTHAVVVKATPFGFLTGSQNGNLNFWDKSGVFVKSLKIHDDIIKKISYNEDIGIITCSNDATVKVISPDGRILNTFMGHSGYVFTCCSLGLDVVSAGDDKCVKIWKDSNCIDSIAHPNSIWDIGVNYLGDIVTAGADSFTRIFTLDKSRLANDKEIQEYDTLCSGMQENNEELDLEKYPLISELQHKRGKKEGDIQIFRNGNIGEAYMWHIDGSYWERIGEVVGANPQQKSQKKYYEGDRLFPSGEYEYIFDVELGDDVIKKLPYNNSQNPLEIAEKFIAREGMRRDYIQEITKFINNNAKPAVTAPAPKPQQVTSKYFPQSVCQEISGGNLPGIVNKIKEFNAQIEGPNRLEEIDIRTLERISATLSNPRTYNSTSLTVKDIEVIMRLGRWPKPLLFPCYDLYRISLLHYSMQEIFKGADHGAEHIEKVCGVLAGPNENPILITGLKVLCNMFYGNSSQYTMETHREIVLDSALTHVDNTNKSVRFGLITLLFNYSVRLAGKNDSDGKIQILAAFVEIFQNETDPDNLLRAFTTVGNLFTGGVIRTELIKSAKELGLADVIRSIKCTDKANECREELVNLLR